MANSRRRKHRAETTANRAHAKAGLTAVASVVTVITLVLVTVGSLFAPSGASDAGVRWYHRPWITKSTKTVTASPTRPRPTATATTTATATATKTVSGPTATVTAPRSTPTRSPSPTATKSSPATHGQAPYVGAAVQNNGNPASIEAAAGRPLGLHRTYWNYNNVASSIKQAKADARAGRIPWLSYKLSVSWADAAAGRADAATRALASQLATVPGPVWVAIHHEPEGDGNLSQWVAVQRRLLPLLAAAPNVRTSIILTAWDTFDSGNPDYKLAAVWPGKMVDILGFDAYNPYGDAKHQGKGWVEMKHYYDEIAPAAEKFGVDWAIAETGYTDAAAKRDPDWLTRAYDDMANRTDLPGLGLCYFDSTANSIGSWRLTGVKATKFRAILKESRK